MTYRYADIVVLAILSTGFAFLGTPRVYAQETVTVGAPQQTIVVQGNGEVKVKADIARLTLGVTNQAKDAAAAAQENARRTEALIKAIRAAGVAEVDIQTVDYNLNPQERLEPNREPTILGYQATNSVRVTIRKLIDAGKVLDTAVKAGANVAEGIRFDLNEADSAKAYDEALTKAVQEARRKAEVLARAGKLGRIDITLITENRADSNLPTVSFYANNKEAAQTPINSGELTISASITVQYRFNSAMQPNY